ncbi:nickel pincer cofactor biosynthesis protein LarC [Phytomonospora endophytica]|uniref:Pyridinium-3,5-bisthiocarboxylic acid mononucleotide nickel insertion protein n=1 Tax=Phytomonospora endophytica TaxID=714109 RepID=A0A841FNC6_9ACTN|nr:nickel pincer cofactor biosynthesis protein LarC [Phytomonospora endophytica]MBB6035062.1 hypothetical protein [Phytomonospora endophytica]GIG64191.1 UPF0272 protein Cgl2470/cg2715 [Phytomonospora endophytica]
MIGWLDCGAGASGDMFLGALVDAGVPLEILQESVDALGVERVELHADPVTRHGLAATHVRVECPPTKVDRRFVAIRELIQAAPLPREVRDEAVGAFTRLGHAESAAHRVELERVHFHEVGALDSLADMVAACAGMHWLRVHRGLSTVTASQVTVGGGVTRGAHGGIPLPAPATLAVLGAADAPVSGEVPYEACTPTGAALIAAFASGYGPLPPMRVRAIGVGAGGRDPKERANLLRLVLGEPAGAVPTGTATVLETNVDDLDPRLWPAVQQALFGAGASDAWLTPILMKKGRPAHTLHVLCRDDVAGAVREAVFAHTTAIGLRSLTVGKHALDREMSTVEVEGRPVSIKLARVGDRVVNVSVEYEDAAALAAEVGVPVKQILAAATAKAYDRYRDGEA